MGGVEEDGLALVELEAEDPGEARVRALGHPGGVERGAALARVVVDVEVGGPQDAEVEDLVLELVAPELGGGGGREKQKQGGGQLDGPRCAPEAGGRPGSHGSGSFTRTMGASPQRRSS